jgi:glutamate-1-semialdehyde aminotransferase
MTSMIAIDTLKLTSHLVRAGIMREHAEAIAAGMNEQMSSNVIPTLATSEQLKAIESNLTNRLEALRSELKAYVDAVITARNGELEARLNRSMFTMLMAFAALIVTLNQLL